MRDAHSLRLPLVAAALSLWLAQSASAVTMDWMFVGNPANPADTRVMNDGTTGYGKVGYDYYIGTYEVTNAQYAEFLNAVAATDPYGLYNPNMGNPSAPDYGGITRTGLSGSYAYSPIAGRENMPVNKVSFWDAVRFTNWLNNGQPVGAAGAGTTETGAYTLTAEGIEHNTVSRNPGAIVVIPSENEWYKAAYYKAVASSYLTYPTDGYQTTCAAPGSTPDTANCENVVGDFTPVGSYTDSASPYGTFDQGGNLWEWNEAIIGIVARGRRGGSFPFSSLNLASAERQNSVATLRDGTLVGFRVATIPGGFVPDADGDGIPDVLDKCMLDSRNVTASCDTDQDGYGNPCDADFDQNFSVNPTDFASYFIPAFKGGPASRGQDVDCSGFVGALDFSNYFVPKFQGALGGAIPGPSGLPCAGTPGCM